MSKQTQIQSAHLTRATFFKRLEELTHEGWSKIPADKSFIIRVDGRSFSKFTKGLPHPKAHNSC